MLVMIQYYKTTLCNDLYTFSGFHIVDYSSSSIVQHIIFASLHTLTFQFPDRGTLYLGTKVTEHLCMYVTFMVQGGCWTTPITDLMTYL